VEISVPRDREGTFEPVIVRKRQRRLGGVQGAGAVADAKGLTTGEVAAYLAESPARRSRARGSGTITDRGPGRDGRVAAAAAGPRVPGAVHRRDPGQDPQAGRSPTGPSTSCSPSPSTVSGTSFRLWAGDGGKGAKLLAARGSPSSKPAVSVTCASWCAMGWPACRMRSAQPGRRRSPRPGIVHLLHEQLPRRLPPGLGGHRQGPAADIHRSHPGRRARPPGRVRESAGRPATRRSSSCERAPGRKVVPFLNVDPEIRTVIATPTRSSRSTPGSVARSAPGALPDRAGRPEMPVPDGGESGPDRPGPPAVEQQVEGRTQRLRLDGHVSKGRK